MEEDRPWATAAASRATEEIVLAPLQIGTLANQGHTKHFSSNTGKWKHSKVAGNLSKAKFQAKVQGQL